MWCFIKTWLDAYDIWKADFLKKSIENRIKESLIIGEEHLSQENHLSCEIITVYNGIYQ